MDALTVTVEVDLRGIPHLLSKIHDQYNKTTYAERFPWVENVKRTNDPSMIQALDALLLLQVESGNLDETWLAPPEVLTWEDVRYFSYSKSASTNGFTDIHWRTLLRSVRAPLSREYLKNRYIFCHGENGVILRQWSAYNCIYAELDFDGRTFLLSNGDWYEVSKDFVAEVNTWFNKFPQRPEPLPTYDHDSEAEYNRFVSDSSGGHFALMDRKMIIHGGGKIEFCDLLGVDGEMVHVKRYAGSSGLSHLFMQGFVAGELLRIDAAFRKKLAAKVPADHFSACGLARAKSSGRRITFGIISRTRGGFVLPFFSKVSLRQASRRLEGYGYPVCITKVEMDEVRGRREKPKSQL